VRDTAAVVADIRALSRDGENEPCEPLDVNEVVQAAVKLALPQVYDTARLELELGEPNPVPVIGSRLGQVVLNLIINATQAMPDRPADRNRVVVSTRAGDAAGAVIEVEDNGVGIPPEIADRLFDPFFTTKPVGQGTGLGLALSHSIVTSFGGELTFQPADPEGTIFRVELPTAGARG